MWYAILFIIISIGAAAYIDIKNKIQLPAPIWFMWGFFTCLIAINIIL